MSHTETNTTVRPEDTPEHTLPRHPYTGEILPRRDAAGVRQPINVRVIRP